MIIAIDFDGTCVTHEFPKVGRDIGAVPVLKELVANGHKLILWTMRSDIDDAKSTDLEIHSGSGKYLTDAVNWFKDNDIELWGIQTNPEQYTWTGSPKAYAQLYIDDAALGCPLKGYLGERPSVDWITVRQQLKGRGLLNKE